MGGFTNIACYIAKDLGSNVAEASLIISAYMIPFGLFQLAFGYLADRFGKRQAISFSMTFFIISTALCATAARITGLAVLLLAVIANALFVATGEILVFVVIGIGFMGLGFMLAHSTFLTIATEFAAMALGVAMSLVAFCFMGGGGLESALGSRIVGSSGMNILFTIYGLGLILVAIGVLFNKRSFVMENY